MTPTNLTEYRTVLHDGDSATDLYFITVGQPGYPHTHIVCERMYDWAANWLVAILQGKEFPGFNTHNK